MTKLTWLTNLVIALGNVATWCLLDKTGIASLRGATFRSPYIGAKVPTLSSRNRHS